MYLIVYLNTDLVSGLLLSQCKDVFDNEFFSYNALDSTINKTLIVSLSNQKG